MSDILNPSTDPPQGYSVRSNPHRQQAAELWRSSAGGAVFRWCGHTDHEAYQLWLEHAESWFKAGLSIDVAFCERVTEVTWERCPQGSKGLRTIQQWLEMANDLAIQPPVREQADTLTTTEREHLTTASDALHQFTQLRTAGTVPDPLRRAHAAIRAALNSEPNASECE